MTDTNIKQNNLSETEQITSEDILQEIIDSATAHAAASDAFIENFMFFGKSLKDWSDQLAVPVPVANTPLEDGGIYKISPADLQELFGKLANNIQVASHFHTVANSISSALNSGGSVKKSDLVAAVVKRYEQSNAKRPAAKVIERMADSYLSNTVSPKVAAKIVKDFFKEKYDVLVEVRKCLEAISYSVNVEVKYLEQEK